jgi:hypothetical protein
MDDGSKIGRYKVRLAAIKRKQQRPKKKRKLPTRTQLSQTKFIKALQGTGGIVKLIAQRLGVADNVVRNRLTNLQNRWPDWTEARQAYVDECERVHDLARETVITKGIQSPDAELAVKTAQWWLERRCAEFAAKNRTVVEGGDTAIQVNVAAVTVDVTLLSVEARRELLEQLERGPRDVVVQDDRVNEAQGPQGETR